MAEKNASVLGEDVFKFFGIAPYDFIPDGQSVSISGVNLWFLKERKGCYGFVPDKIKMSVEDFNRSCKNCGVVTANDLLNRELILTFNRFGKCSSFYFA